MKQLGIKPNSPMARSVANVTNKGKTSRFSDNRLHAVFQTQLVDSIQKKEDRKTFNQSCVQLKCPNIPGYTGPEETAKVWFAETVSRDTGHLFKKKIGGDQETKTSLLRLMTEEVEKQGKNAPKYSSWITSDSDYNKSTKQDIDPYCIRLFGNYKIAQHTQEFYVDVHFGPYNLGYIVSIKDGDEIATMKLPSEEWAPNNYSNVHDQNSSKKDEGLLSSLTLPSTSEPDKRRRRDTITKLIGEGARFNAVKNHQDSLTDSTKFFTRNDDSVQWIAFNKLWSAWSGTFNKGFGITDESIKHHLEANDFKDASGTSITIDNQPPSVIKPQMDYSLLNHKAATENDRHQWDPIDFIFKKKLSKGEINSIEGEVKTTFDKGIVGISSSRSGRTLTVIKWKSKLADELIRDYYSLSKIKDNLKPDKPPAVSPTAINSTEPLSSADNMHIQSLSPEFTTEIPATNDDWSDKFTKKKVEEKIAEMVKKDISANIDDSLIETIFEEGIKLNYIEKSGKHQIRYRMHSSNMQVCVQSMKQSIIDRSKEVEENDTECNHSCPIAPKNISAGTITIGGLILFVVAGILIVKVYK
ncbi:hypothetical protein AAH088_12775 [Bacteroides hominis]|uniref:hypothetical protein n=1 Tax=Bacteroides hominis TaxID=2763023 RepID=UPI0039C33FCC